MTLEFTFTNMKAQCKLTYLAMTKFSGLDILLLFQRASDIFWDFALFLEGGDPVNVEVGPKMELLVCACVFNIDS